MWQLLAAEAVKQKMNNSNSSKATHKDYQFGLKA
jgi:hypothetical protein